MLYVNGKREEAEQIFIQNRAFIDQYLDVRNDTLFKTYKVIKLFHSGNYEEALEIENTEEDIKAVYLHLYRCRIHSLLNNHDLLKKKLEAFASVAEEIPYMNEIKEMRNCL